MRPRSIGVRLTLWFTALFAAAFAVLAGALWLALRESLYRAVDESLHERADGIVHFIEDHETRLDVDEVKEEFRAHGELFQVVDASGRWVHRGAGLADLELPAAAADASIGAATLHGQPARVLTQPVEIGGRRFTVQIAAPLGEVEQGLYGTLRVLVPLFAVSLVLAGAGGYWLSRRALAPVDEITSAARSLTADNLAQRLRVPPAGDELTRLTETLNEMIARLEASFRTVSRFTADASHELRTPLAVMRTTAEVALQRGADPREQTAALEHIVAEIERTTHLVENLLLIAKADSGAAPLAREPVDVAAAVGDACAQASVLARVKGVALASQLPDGPLWTSGDAQALRRLFLILLDNAVKYTPAGGRCDVHVERRGAEIVGTVRDTGIGISSDDLPHVFERFYRVDRARSREQGGAGLGLAIGRWIAEAHGGAIAVESELDGGSSFRVHLPSV